VLLLCFAAVLLLAVLVSSLAHRTILSTAVLFLVAGFVLGPETTGVLDLHPDSPVVAILAELALFAVLFTDGMRVGWTDLRSAWRLPGRALGWGMPLTLVITALAARYLIGLDWPHALLIGAILAPTDPSSLQRWSATNGCRRDCAIYSTWSQASTTGWRCRS
jgi:NhaP-type Na+/H+ or K+/H+ antiporter